MSAEARARSPSDGRSGFDLRILAAAAAHPGLRSLLLLDAGKSQIDAAAQAADGFLAAATGGTDETVELAPYHSEDELWGRGEGLGPPWERPGLLSGAGSAWRVVVVRNLAVLERMPARALIQLMEHPEARLERHGQSRIFAPRIFWLAACAREEIGQVSGHLIDRFSLRLQCRSEALTDRLERLSTWADGGMQTETRATILPQTEIDHLARALASPSPWPRIGEKSETLLTSAAGLDHHGNRRALTMARLAVALARLDRSAVESRHVEEALKAFGLERSPKTGDSATASPQPLTEPGDFEPPERAARRPDTAPARGATAPQGTTQGATAPVAPGAEAALEAELAAEQASAQSAAVAVNAFPEDEAPARHEHAALRPLATRGARHRDEDRGPVIGTKRAEALADLAIVPTLMAAAPYQTLRRRNTGAPEDRLLLQQSDLRAWRREPAPTDLVVILLDRTAVTEAAWTEALAPYLRGAYQRRSAVSLVLVGGAAPEGSLEKELKAELIAARSVLVPELFLAFSRGPARATPLAHGLQLARQALATALHRGRGSVDAVRLVALSDGRGNVPLSASECGRIAPGRGREGLTDALAEARKIAAERHVHSVLLDPCSRFGRAHALALGDALQAEVVEMAPAREAAA